MVKTNNFTNFYDIAYFSILASGPYLDSTITSETIFRSSSIDAIIIFNCGPLIMDASLVLEDAFGRFRISPIIKGFKLSLIVFYFRMVHKKKLFRRSSVKYWTFSEGPAWSGYLEKMKSRHKLSKHCTNMVKIEKFLVRIIFIP